MPGINADQVKDRKRIVRELGNEHGASKANENISDQQQAINTLTVFALEQITRRLEAATTFEQL